MTGDTCSDADACTIGDECVQVGGTYMSPNECLSGRPAVCNDRNPCTDDACATASGCVALPKQDGFPCLVGGQAGSCLASKCVSNQPSQAMIIPAGQMGVEECGNLHPDGQAGAWAECTATKADKGATKRLVLHLDGKGQETATVPLPGGWDQLVGSSGKGHALVSLYDGKITKLQRIDHQGTLMALTSLTGRVGQALELPGGDLLVVSEAEGLRRVTAFGQTVWKVGIDYPSYGVMLEPPSIQRFGDTLLLAYQNFWYPQPSKGNLFPDPYVGLDLRAISVAGQELWHYGETCLGNGCQAQPAGIWPGAPKSSSVATIVVPQPAGWVVIGSFWQGDYQASVDAVYRIALDAKGKRQSTDLLWPVMPQCGWAFGTVLPIGVTAYVAACQGTRLAWFDALGTPIGEDSFGQGSFGAARGLAAAGSAAVWLAMDGAEARLVRLPAPVTGCTFEQ